MNAPFLPAVASAMPPASGAPTRCADEAGAAGNHYRGYRIEPNDRLFPRAGAWKFSQSPAHATHYADSIPDARKKIDLMLVRKAVFEVAEHHGRGVFFDSTNATCRAMGIETMPERARGRFARAFAEIATCRPGRPL